MKDKDVCMGCKYYVEHHNMPIFDGTCDYSDRTGKSRLVKEMLNGGYREDSCICYEQGKRKVRKAQPVVMKGGKKE